MREDFPWREHTEMHTSIYVAMAYRVLYTNLPVIVPHRIISIEARFDECYRNPKQSFNCWTPNASHDCAI